MKEIKPLAQIDRLKPETTALFIGDMQKYGGRGSSFTNALIKEGFDLSYWFDRIENIIVPNIKKLITFFRDKKLRIAYSYVYSEVEGCGDWPKPLRARFIELGLFPLRPGMKEYEYIEEIKPQPGDIWVHKHCISPFHNTGLSDILKGLGITDVVITGVATNGCPGMAAVYAANDGFGVVFVEDATGAFYQDIHDKWIELHSSFYFRVASTDEVIKELSS